MQIKHHKSTGGFVRGVCWPYQQLARNGWIKPIAQLCSMPARLTLHNGFCQLSVFILLSHLVDAQIPNQAVRNSQALFWKPQPYITEWAQSSVQMPSDLVAFNRRRFELDHHHESRSSENELKMGEMIEAKLAGIPEQILATLPDDTSKQLLDMFKSDRTLITGIPMIDSPSSFMLDSNSIDDPENASIDRLTKSCLTVHARSARPEQLNVTFYLYTRNNPKVPFVMDFQVSRNELLNNSPFESKRPVKWLTHGFHTDSDKSDWMHEAKDKILAFEDANVFMTDWRRGASPALAFYPKAAANAHIVAKMIVNILRRLHGNIDLAHVHLIGHSLGAHISGFVGSAFTEEYLRQQQQLANENPHHWHELNGRRTAFRGENQLIGRITACDPALPCFGSKSSAPNRRSNKLKLGSIKGDQERVGSVGDDWIPTTWTHLRPDSAILVEVMHSNSGFMGYLEPLGDFDFYPNGVGLQPGCNAGRAERRRRAADDASLSPWLRQISWLINSARGAQVMDKDGLRLKKIASTLETFFKPIRDFFTDHTCSHHRSVELMVESLYYEQIPSSLRLKRDHICQMVGYRCASYEAFKRGFCFRCDRELDCRVLAMSGPGTNKLSMISPSTHSETSRIVSKRSISKSNENHVFKRILPTFNQFEQYYLPTIRNQYYFDTRDTRDFCLHHYHIYIRYKWMRVSNQVTIDGFEIVGTLSNLTIRSSLTLSRYTHQSYTALLTEPTFLGQLESLVIVGEKIKPTLIEYVEVTYMSNLAPNVRASTSARLCRNPQVTSSDIVTIPLRSTNDQGFIEKNYLFTRCTNSMA